MTQIQDFFGINSKETYLEVCSIIKSILKERLSNVSFNKAVMSKNMPIFEKWKTDLYRCEDENLKKDILSKQYIYNYNTPHFYNMLQNESFTYWQFTLTDYFKTNGIQYKSFDKNHPVQNEQWDLTFLHIVYNQIRNKKPHTTKDECYVSHYAYKTFLARLQKYITMAQTAKKGDTNAISIP